MACAVEASEALAKGAKRTGSAELFSKMLDCKSTWQLQRKKGSEKMKAQLALQLVPRLGNAIEGLVAESMLQLGYSRPDPCPTERLQTKFQDGVFNLKHYAVSSSKATIIQLRLMSSAGYKL